MTLRQQLRWIDQELQRCAWVLNPPYVVGATLQDKALEDQTALRAIRASLESLQVRQVALPRYEPRDGKGR